ncbi:MAG: PorP/SprF family type IX secretion system membrane protein [Saprospiraceae bacterium]|nr:PorP/SprF family type IX secretion system membrane protein [Saprospiraceae bacterium]
MQSRLLPTCRWKAVLFVVISFCCLTPKSWSQDPSFSQFYANRIYLNPAFTGLDRGVAVSGVSRAQWLRVDRAFLTYGLTAEMQIPIVRLGLGLHLMRDEEGIGALTTQQAGLALSYTIPGEKNNFHFGFEGRLVQKTIDWNKLVFSDQLDPVFGVVSASSAVPATENILYGDVDFGMVWRSETSLRSGRKGLSQIRSHLGFSMNHLPQLFNKSARGSDSFLNRDVAIAPRTTLHGGLIIPVHFLSGVGEEIAISPNFKFDVQGYGFLNFPNSLTVGTVGLYTLLDHFHLGLFYQNKYYAPDGTHTDALIVSVGGQTNPGGRENPKKPSMIFGLSADFNNTGLSAAAGSVFELTFRIVFPASAGARGRSRSSSRKILDCKSFF